MPLDEGFVLFPLTEEIQARLCDGDRVAVLGFDRLCGPIAQLGSELSDAGSVAYVHSAFFGGHARSTIPVTATAPPAINPV